MFMGAFLYSLADRWTGSGGSDGRSAGAAARDTTTPAPSESRQAERALEVAPPSAATRRRSAEAELDRARIRVEVLNGAGVPGLADRMTGFLRSRGFDVVNYGNAPRTLGRRTEVLDRVGNPRFAREVARALPGTPIRLDSSPGRFIDVTVIVGTDYERFFEPPTGREPERAGPLRQALRNVRRLLGL
jgi:hypothetical protein